MFFSIHGRHLEVEVNLWGIRLSTNVHQTVDADGVVGKRVTDVKVGEADTVNGIDCLKVECCIIRIASKDNRTSAIEGKVLLNDVLDSNAVGAVVDGIGSEHIESPLVMERGSNGSIAIESDIIL